MSNNVIKLFYVEQGRSSLWTIDPTMNTNIGCLKYWGICQK